MHWKHASRCFHCIHPKTEGRRHNIENKKKRSTQRQLFVSLSTPRCHTGSSSYASLHSLQFGASKWPAGCTRQTQCEHMGRTARPEEVMWDQHQRPPQPCVYPRELFVYAQQIFITLWVAQKCFVVQPQRFGANKQIRCRVCQSNGRRCQFRKVLVGVWLSSAKTHFECLHLQFETRLRGHIMSASHTSFWMLKLIASNFSTKTWSSILVWCNLAQWLSTTKL